MTEPAPQELSNSEIFDGERLSWIQRALIVLGPLGLAIDIFASLWVSSLHVTHSVRVQVERQMVPGEKLAVRAQLLDRRGDAVDDVGVSLHLVPPSGAVLDLGALTAVDAAVSQGTFNVPATIMAGGVQAWPMECALELRLEAPEALGVGLVRERVAVTMVKERDERERMLSVARSMLQWADDTEEQPETVRVDLRPFGRILAGFQNTFLVRVTDLEGIPYAGLVEIRLLSGEFAAKRGQESDPPVLFRGSLDGLGTTSISGQLTSEVIRFEVGLLSDASEFPSSSRRFRWVSHAGGVRVSTSSMVASKGATIMVGATALSARRPIYVDIHGPDGAWIDTLTPPLRLTKQAREWRIPSRWTDGSFMQIEAYHFTAAPDDSAAVGRVLLGAADQVDSPESLIALLERQRALLDLPRVEKYFDLERENKYLDYVEGAELSALEVKSARQWLMGTLPIEVYGPPMALDTRPRDEKLLLARKTRWIVGLRWFLWCGGGLFMAILGAALWWENHQVRAKAREAMGDDFDLGALAQEGRQMWGRLVLVLAFTAATLALTIALLESLVWVL